VIAVVETLGIHAHARVGPNSHGSTSRLAPNRCEQDASIGALVGGVVSGVHRRGEMFEADALSLVRRYVT
jgi:hypothetical protein